MALPIDGPVRVEVNPFGVTPGDAPNIFIMDAKGSAVCIIAKHPVWNHLEQKRLQLAKELAAVIKKELGIN